VSGGIREQILNFCSKEKITTMPPRRRQEIPMLDPTMEREMRELCDQLDSMEKTQKQTVDARDVSESQNENEARPDEEEIAVEDVAEERLFRVVIRIGAREKVGIER
jgi:hypothetical protein